MLKETVVNLNMAIKALCPGFDGTYSVDDDGNIVNWNPASNIPQPTREQIDAAMPMAKNALIMSAIRAERDRRVAATDYTAMADYPAAKKPAGLDAYRQALRDYPATIDPSTLQWPVDVNALAWPVL